MSAPGAKDNYQIADSSKVLLRCATCKEAVREGETHICVSVTAVIDDKKESKQEPMTIEEFLKRNSIEI